MIRRVWTRNREARPLVWNMHECDINFCFGHTYTTELRTHSSQADKLRLTLSTETDTRQKKMVATETRLEARASR